jgi:hypothetical protein
MNRMLMTLAGVALVAAPLSAGETCGHGTKLDFVSNPKEAATIAKKEQKLVLVLHVSGHFEDPGLT